MPQKSSNPGQGKGVHYDACRCQECRIVRRLRVRFPSMTQWWFSREDQVATFVERGVHGDGIWLWDGWLDDVFLLHRGVVGETLRSPTLRPRTRLVYFSRLGRDRGIWSVTTQGTDLLQVTSREDVGLTWSADGNRLVFFRRDGEVRGHLVVLHLDTGKTIRVGLPPGVYLPLEFSRDGNALRYLAISFRDGHVLVKEGCVRYEAAR